MNKKQKTRAIIIFICLFVVILAGTILTGTAGHGAGEDISVAMKDAVLHETYKVSLFGLIDVNPGLISAFIVTGVFLIFCIIVRIFVIPKFKTIPGKFQLLLETAVGLFSNMAKANSPHSYSFLGAYIFVAGAYICVSTLFELFGIQVMTTLGTPISLPAPLSDINGAVCLGVLSYLVIFIGGVVKNKFKGVGKALKEFSLPISMSFRLFGALLSGALVTDLIYHASVTSYGIPVIVGVLFTILHALIQAYVLTTIASTYFGEVTEPSVKKPKKTKKASA
ncbi:MAG: F0F1 ATP synthase subunit A [Lachnospiraceae bacterium]|nr:F0F1 ATP synthase subunit A [Lachnospiraceae bacterium]